MYGCGEDLQGKPYLQGKTILKVSNLCNVLLDIMLVEFILENKNSIAFSIHPKLAIC